MRNVLYITYDGLTEPLGQSQILAYLKRLSDAGNRITLLSFEKEELFSKGEARIRAITDAHRIRWVPLSYTKKPPILSTLKDVRKGMKASRELHAQHRFQIVHCRGYIPALMGLKLQKRFGIRFIFDMRGWWADEKLESGYWNSPVYKPVYKYFKGLERRYFAACDYAVSLTYKGKEEIAKQGLAAPEKVGVIPTCVDFDIFKPWEAGFRNAMRQKLGIGEDEKVFVYSGSVGGNYDSETLFKVFGAFRRLFANSYLLVLSKDSVNEELKARFNEAGIHRYEVLNSPFTEVTNYLRAADVGFIYYRMSFSTIGRSPTKLGEYWASGIPVIAFKGIGDLDVILDRYQDSGVLLSEDESRWDEELKALTFPDRERLRGYAKDYFHIDKGVTFYEHVYEKLQPKQ